MDPVSTGIGTAASVLTLAQATLTLSVTVYSLFGALSSASEDLEHLANDLKTFSESLTMLSGLLDDNKALYADGIYVLAAKVIKDCVILYKEIDASLEKLKSKGGKSSWTKKMKFVAKGPQIRKQLGRLNDLKSTLDKILKTLEFDLWFTSLNKSSPSMIQRPIQQQLQPETIHILEGVEKAVEDTRIFLIEATHSTENVQTQDRGIESIQKSGAHFTAQKLTVNTSIPTVKTAYSTSRSSIYTERSTSIKSTSSMESFRSAMSKPDSHAQLVSEVEDIIHAFRYALKILRKIIKKRIRDEAEGLHPSAQDLKASLNSGKDTVHRVHRSHFRTHGENYVRQLRGSTLEELQAVTSKLLGEVVAVLIMYSANHAIISSESFESPRIWSKRCRIKTVFELDRTTVLLLRQPLNLALFASDSLLINGWCQKKPVISSSPVTSNRDGRSLVYVTEKQVERRLLIDKGWLERLQEQTAPKTGTSHEPAPQKLNPASSRIQPDEVPYLEIRPKTKERSSSSKNSTTAGRQFFIKGEGIDREVISTDICRYLGNDALVRPGTYMDPETGEDFDGYYITAYRAPTTTQLADLRADSQKWQEEKRKKCPDGYAHSSVRREIWEDNQDPTLYGIHQTYSQQPSADVGRYWSYVVPPLQSQQPPSVVVRHWKSLPPQSRQPPLNVGRHWTSLPPQSQQPYADIDRNWTSLLPPNQSSIASVDRSHIYHYGSQDPYAPAGSYRNTGEHTAPVLINESRPQGAIVSHNTPKMDTSDSIKSKVAQGPPPIMAISFVRPEDQPGSSNYFHSNSSHKNSSAGGKAPTEISHSEHSLPGNDCVNESLFGTKDEYASDGDETKLDDRRTLACAPSGTGKREETRTFQARRDYPDLDSASSEDSLSTKSSRRQKSGWTNPSEKQLTKTWWQAYRGLCDSHPSYIRRLNSVISDELTFEISLWVHKDAEWSLKITKAIKTLKPVKRILKELTTAKETRDNIIEILEAASETIGFETASLAWGCILCSLKKFENIFKLRTKDLEPNEQDPGGSETLEYIESIAEIYCQLKDIISVIARYAVMENLYQQTPETSLQSDYKAAIIQLYCEVLKWFHNVLCFRSVYHEKLQKSAKLLETIKEMDRACQKFKTSVGANDESGVETGGFGLGYMNLLNTHSQVVKSAI